MSDIEKRLILSSDVVSGRSDFHDRTFRIYGAIACLESKTPIASGCRRRCYNTGGSITDIQQTNFDAITLKTSPRSEWGKWVVAIQRESTVTWQSPLHVPGVERETHGDQMDVQTTAWLMVHKMAGNSAVGSAVVLEAYLPPVVHATDALGNWVYVAVHPDVKRGLPECITSQYDQAYDWIEHTAASLGIVLAPPGE